MSQRERPSFRRPREGDLEKDLRPSFKEYEEWRGQAAGAAGAPTAEPAKPAKKRFKIGRWDIIFVLLGALGGLIYQSCKAAR